MSSRVAHGFDVFHHGDYQHLGVDPGRSFLPADADAVVLGAATAHAPVAVGVVAGGSGYRGGLLAGVDVRHDYPLQPAVEIAQYGCVGMVGNAGDGRDAEGLGGADHVLHLVEVCGAVLAVNHYEVVAESTENLHHVGRVAGDDGPEYDSALVELGLGGVGAHRVSSCLKSSDGFGDCLNQDYQDARMLRIIRMQGCSGLSGCKDAQDGGNLS